MEDRRARGKAELARQPHVRVEEGTRNYDSTLEHYPNAI